MSRTRLICGGGVSLLFWQGGGLFEAIFLFYTYLHVVFDYMLQLKCFIVIQLHVAN